MRMCEVLFWNSIGRPQFSGSGHACSQTVLNRVQGHARTRFYLALGLVGDGFGDQVVLKKPFRYASFMS